MKINMEFESQMCTNREQSERLLSLGLKRDTADMHHYKWSEGYWDIQSCPPRGTESCYIPAWSLHRLIEIAGIRAFSPVSSLHGWYDDIIAQIQSLIHIGYIDEKYLDMDVVNKREEKNMELLKNN